MRTNKTLLLVLCFFGVFLFAIFSINAATPTRLAVTSEDVVPTPVSRWSDVLDVAFSNLHDFVTTLYVGQPRQVVTVDVPGTFSYSVVQQPLNEPDFVSSDPEIVTQFRLASEYGTMGLLAHNTLAGSEFYNLEKGQRITLTYADMRTQDFIVREFLSYQAMDPTSPFSEFKSLDGEGHKVSSTDLFNMVYTKTGQAVLQTCIAANGDPNWGRYFVIADPAERVLTFSKLSLLPQ